jgi:hypothetical protein
MVKSHYRTDNSFSVRLNRNCPLLLGQPFWTKGCYMSKVRELFVRISEAFLGVGAGSSRPKGIAEHH